MRQSQLFTKTRKDVSQDELSRNAQLLLRAGFIHKEMAGVYVFLPLGKRVLDKIANIVREEMNRLGGTEVQMSILQPKEIWEQTGRWDDKKVDNWFKTKLSNGTELGIGLTHEEPMIDMLKEYVQSHKDLPVYVYQIQSKFRNELRAKSGLLRGREFLMKDLYSFSRTQEEHAAFYEKAIQAYHQVYARLGLGKDTYTTFASGGIFSEFSHEFQTVCDVGEDTIYVHEEKRLAINKEVYTDEIIATLGLKKEELIEKRAVEVGNIFSLGSTYADALNLYYQDSDGKQQSIIMGCYGIGVSRLMGLLVEYFFDDQGIIWPKEIAPFAVHLLSLCKTPEDIEKADALYLQLQQAGIEVLYDDRPDARAGEKFMDSDLMGMPTRVIISPKTIEQNAVEVKERTATESRIVPMADLIATLK